MFNLHPLNSVQLLRIGSIDFITCSAHGSSKQATNSIRNKLSPGSAVHVVTYSSVWSWQRDSWSTLVVKAVDTWIIWLHCAGETFADVQTWEASRYKQTQTSSNLQPSTSNSDFVVSWSCFCFCKEKKKTLSQRTGQAPQLSPCCLYPLSIFWPSVRATAK